MSLFHGPDRLPSIDRESAQAVLAHVPMAREKNVLAYSWANARFVEAAETCFGQEGASFLFGALTVDRLQGDQLGTAVLGQARLLPADRTAPRGLDQVVVDELIACARVPLNQGIDAPSSAQRSPDLG